MSAAAEIDRIKARLTVLVHKRNAAIKAGDEVAQMNATLEIDELLGRLSDAQKAA